MRIPVNSRSMVTSTKRGGKPWVSSTSARTRCMPSARRRHSEISMGPLAAHERKGNFYHDQRERSAGFAFELLDDGGDHIEHLLLLSARKFLHLIEEAASLSGGRGTPRKRGVKVEEFFDAYAEYISELGQHIGAGWLFCALPEGNICLGLADQAG